MTKTTNYEISKKLAEIGFEAKANHGWHKDNLESEPAEFLSNYALEFLSNYAFCTNYIKAFDLETLLDALPKKLISTNKRNRYFWINYSCCHDCWAIGYQKQDNTRDTDLEIFAEDGESLADTAGRLIILLESKNLIKF